MKIGKDFYRNSVKWLFSDILNRNMKYTFQQHMDRILY